MQSAVDLFFAVEDIRIDNKIKSFVIKIVAEIFSADGGGYTADVSFLSFCVYLIEYLLFYINREYPAFLVESISRCDGVIPFAAAVIEDNGVGGVGQLRNKFLTLGFLPVSDLVKNTHSVPPDRYWSADIYLLAVRSLYAHGLR